jgi:hypothetical protein
MTTLIFLNFIALYGDIIARFHLLKELPTLKGLVVDNHPTIILQSF